MCKFTLPWSCRSKIVASRSDVVAMSAGGRRRGGGGRFGGGVRFRSKPVAFRSKAVRSHFVAPVTINA